MEIASRANRDLDSSRARISADSSRARRDVIADDSFDERYLKADEGLARFIGIRGIGAINLCQVNHDCFKGHPRKTP